MTKSISFIVTAYNEEKYIEKTILNILNFVNNFKIDYEILIINDGSTDNTGKIIRKLAKKYKKIKIIEHKKNLGIGKTIADGIKNASKEYFTYIPGDNQFSFSSFEEYLKKIKNYDLIIGYIKNPKARKLHRRLGSSLFMFVIRLLFNLKKVKYTNGFNLIKTSLVKNMELESTGHSISSEIIIKILKFRKLKYKINGFELISKHPEVTTAFKLKSIINAIYFTIRLWIKIYILKEKY